MLYVCIVMAVLHKWLICFELRRSVLSGCCYDYPVWGRQTDGLTRGGAGLGGGEEGLGEEGRGWNRATIEDGLKRDRQEAPVCTGPRTGRNPQGPPPERVSLLRDRKSVV